jgi:hypothetical protein
MPELTEVLPDLPPNGPGIRLPRGLGLRLSAGNGMMVLGCSRVGVRPSANEMEAVVAAVTAVFQPTAVFQAEKPELRVIGQEEHFIWRLYWPLEGVKLMQQQPVQEALF